MQATIGAPALAFRNTQLTPVSRNGQIWLTAAELARALGYARTDLVTRVYERNAEEFSDSMTVTVKLTVTGSPCPTAVRIFSLRGAHLIAMFARTPVAAEFRRWVLDILDREVGALVQAPAAPPPLDLDELRRIRKQVVAIGSEVLPERLASFAEFTENRILIDCGLRSWEQADGTTLAYARSFVNGLRFKAIEMKAAQSALASRYWLWMFKPRQDRLPDERELSPVLLDTDSYFPEPL